MKVYLAGPITGLTYNQGQSWREDAKRLLATHGIHGYSPLRGKEYLKAHGLLEGSYEAYALSSARGITTRDRYDVGSADAVLMYLKGAEIVSIGSCIELGWADAFRKPVVLVMEKSGAKHMHPMVAETVGYHVETLEEAVNLLAIILRHEIVGALQHETPAVSIAAPDQTQSLTSRCIR